jgi:SAM-dependent methyltransferase
MSIFGSLKRFKEKQDFQPGILGMFTNPFYIARRGLYKSIRVLAPSLRGTILDVGCGRKPYRHLFQYTEYIGMDIENPGHDHSQEEIDVYYDGKVFPFPDNKFDNVLCNQVLEHVFEPVPFLKEINRVLKPGGCFLLTVPFVWDEHEQPNDYARYSSFGLKYLLEQNGFELVEQKRSVNNLGTVFQLINAYIYKKVITRNGILNQFLIFLLMSPFSVIGTLFGIIFPNNNDLYLDNIVLAKKRNTDA